MGRNHKKREYDWDQFQVRISLGSKVMTESRFEEKKFSRILERKKILEKIKNKFF